MLPYYLLVAIPLFLSTPEYLFPPSRGRTRWNRVPVWLFFIGLFCLLSLRHLSIGVDTARYAWHFKQLAKLPWKKFLAYRDGEWAFFLLCKVIATLGGNERTMLVVSALLCVLPVAVLYVTRTVSPSLTLSMYPVLPIFMMSFSGLRQAIAVSLAVPVYCAVVKKQWIRAFLWMALAFFFHRTALVLLLFIPALRMRLRLSHLPALLVLYAAVYAARRPLFSICLRILGESDRYEEMTESGGGSMLLLFVGCLLLSFLIPFETSLDDETRGMRNLLSIAVLIQLFSSVHPLSMRMNYYFILFIPLFMGRVLSVEGRMAASLASALRLSMAAFFVVFYIARIMVSDSLAIYPYRPFWL